MDDEDDYILEIEALDEELIDTKPFEPRSKSSSNTKPNSRPTLFCPIYGCRYQTDRRGDLRRHFRTQKHKHDPLPDDSEEEIPSSVFNCEACNYKTADRFCFNRHMKSIKHNRKFAPQPTEPTSPVETNEEMPEQLDVLETFDGRVFTCVTCNYQTDKSFFFNRHKQSLKHQQLELVKLEENEVDVGELIEYSPIETETHQSDKQEEEEEEEEEFIICKKEDMEYVDELPETTEEELEIDYCLTNNNISIANDNNIEETCYYMMLN